MTRSGRSARSARSARSPPSSSTSRNKREMTEVLTMAQSRTFQPDRKYDSSEAQSPKTSILSAISSVKIAVNVTSARKSVVASGEPGTTLGTSKASATDESAMHTMMNASNAGALTRRLNRRIITPRDPPVSSSSGSECRPRLFSPGSPRPILGSPRPILGSHRPILGSPRPCANSSSAAVLLAHQPRLARAADAARSATRRSRSAIRMSFKSAMSSG